MQSYSRDAMAHSWVDTPNRIRRFQTRFKKFRKSGCREEREKKCAAHDVSVPDSDCNYNNE